MNGTTDSRAARIGNPWAPVRRYAAVFLAGAATAAVLHHALRPEFAAPFSAAGNATAGVELVAGKPSEGAPLRPLSAAAATAPAVPATMPLVTTAPAATAVARRPVALPAPVPTYMVRPETFAVSIPLAGEFRPAHAVDLRSPVEGTTSVWQVVPEGTPVKVGDVVATLASDGIESRLATARLALQDATTAQVGSKQALAMQQLENEAALKTAQGNVELVGLEYEQFDKGDARIQTDTLETAVANARCDLERKTKDLKAMEELATRGFVPDNDLLDARTAQRDARQKLDTQIQNLNVWTTLAQPRQRKILQRKCADAAAEVERTRRRNEAGLVIKQTDLHAKDVALATATQQLLFLHSQQAACHIRATVAGMVLYPPGGCGVGTVVGQNQVLLLLADAAPLTVHALLPEDYVTRVQAGQAVTVCTPALPGKVLRGKVQQVGLLPEPARPGAASRDFRLDIVLEDADEHLRPNLSARLEILGYRLVDVVAVPPQAIFATAGQPCVLVGSAEHFEERPVKVGLVAPNQVEIREGLKWGQRVLLARPQPAVATAALVEGVEGAEGGP